MSSDVESSIRSGELIARISQCFANVKLGEGVSWHQADEIDNHGSVDELRSARARDAEKPWRDVSSAIFDELPSAVGFLDSKGLLYYLPAFMVADLRRNGSWNSAVDDGFVSALRESAPSRELQSLLSDDQRQVTADWLDIVRRRYLGLPRDGVDNWKSFVTSFRGS
jgi:hypothetical protein